MKFALMAALALVAASAAGAAAEQNVVGAGTSMTCIAQAQDPNADLGAAVQGCTDALQFQPMSVSDRVGTLINRGILRARMHDATGAMADYSEAISMDDQAAQAYLNRSATLIGLKRYSEAKSDADKAISLHASPLEVGYFNRAVAEEGLGNVKAAYDDYNAALKVQPNFQPARDELKRFKVTGSSS
jgi:tetratricopeptide (TPR) repeat protein